MAPIPMKLRCPNDDCLKYHVDEGEWATKPHKTHLCASCGAEWQPANVDTVGVFRLPTPSIFTRPGTEMIADERHRQITSEGYTAKHDDTHADDAMAWAAVCYAAPERVYRQVVFATQIAFRDPWRWDDFHDKRPHHGNVPAPEKATPAERVTLLVKAGALCAAEVDRLLRKQVADACKPKAP